MPQVEARCNPHPVDQSYLAELKEFVTLHVRSQATDAADYEAVLQRISNENRGPGGWTHEWMEGARHFEETGKVLEAIQCYNFARFPFVDNPDRTTAHSRCVRQFADWVTSQHARVTRVGVRVANTTVPVYNMNTDEERPLLLVIGGIVSLKEQWHKLLFGADKLGFLPVIAEFPGVGENPLPFTPESDSFISSLLDHFGATAQRTYVVGMSFGGYLAMKAAGTDTRIKGITTLGAPVSHFYTDAAWWNRVPDVTKRTLSHVCKVPAKDLFAFLSRFTLTAGDLRRIGVPVHYLLSLRDEIIPPQEREVLERNVHRLNLTILDDVHGAANHMGVLKKYIPWSIVRQRSGAVAPLTLMLRAALAAAMWKRRVTA